MNDFPETDLDALRKSRIERLEAELHELASRLTHLHWPSTDAEVTDCRQIRLRYTSSYDYFPYRSTGPAVPKGYAVGFRYQVDGTTYDGTLHSSVEVEPCDRFKLRYNPDHPNENNSFCSDNSPSTIYATAINVVLAVLAIVFLFAFLKDHVLKLLRH